MDGRTHRRTDARMDNVKTVYPPQTKFVGGITKHPDYNQKGAISVVFTHENIFCGAH